MVEMKGLYTPVQVLLGYGRDELLLGYDRDVKDLVYSYTSAARVW